MRVAPFAVALLLLSVVAAMAESSDLLRDYALEVRTVQVSALVTKDVVHVKLADGTSPDLNTFMQEIVPATLKATGDLPARADVPTMVYDVAVPRCKVGFIYNQGALPLLLRVRADKISMSGINEKSHERFDGVVFNGWGLRSYFITQYTVVSRATKYHATERVTFTHKGFHWVDP